MKEKIIYKKFYFIERSVKFILSLIFLTTSLSCQMSEKKLKELKKETAIQNPFEINRVNEVKNSEAEEGKKKKKASSPSAMKKKKVSSPSAVKKKNLIIKKDLKVKKTKSKELRLKSNKKAKLLTKNIEEKAKKLSGSFPFGVGEKITYSIRFFALEAGKFTFEVKPFKTINNKPVFHFYITAKSSPLFSLFYSVKDFAESFWDMELKRPFLMKIYGKESKYVREVQTTFNWKKKKARYQANIKKVGKKLDKEDKSWTLKHKDAQDIISALYYLRTQKISVGADYAFRVAEKGQDILVKGKVLREETLKTRVGKFQTYVVRPSFNVDGAWKPVGDITIWLTKDKKKIPVQFEAKIRIGTIRGRLHSLVKAP